jgi:hypothetical protein
MHSLVEIRLSSCPVLCRPSHVIHGHAQLPLEHDYMHLPSERPVQNSTNHTPTTLHLNPLLAMAATRAKHMLAKTGPYWNCCRNLQQGKSK